MHPTALSNAKLFFESYGPSFGESSPVRIVDIGSLDINGSLRSVAPPRFEYVGVDFAQGKGVDVVLDDPYSFPLESGSADIVLSSSCFEHSEMFWLVFLEIMRILKPEGLFYLNVPSNGMFHRHPVDCWRFYPDSGNALVTWARRNGIPALLLESYIGNQRGDLWNDFVGVFLKEQRYLDRYPRRIVDGFQDFRNGIKHGEREFRNLSPNCEDQFKLRIIEGIVNNSVKIS